MFSVLINSCISLSFYLVILSIENIRNIKNEKNRHEKEKDIQLEAPHYIKKANSGTAKLVAAYALLNLSHVSVLCTE